MWKKAALATTLLLAGCTGESPDINPSSSPLPVFSNCDPIYPRSWDIFPKDGFTQPEVQRIAAALGITVSQAETSLYGAVLCDKPMTNEQVRSGESIISVRDIGERCLAIHVINETGPQEGQLYDRFMAVCPVL